MRTFYYYTTRNFGDRMNAWLWPRLVPELLAERDDLVLVGIGSLIKSDLAKVPGRKIVFGTGSGYGPMPLPEEVDNWRVYCVRGPLTARLMGLPESAALVDAAWLIDLLPEYRLSLRQRSGTVFVPHWTTDLYANWRQPCADAGIRYVDPHGDGADVLSAIAGADLAIVESLHGAIIADYYRTPWIPVASDERVLEFKWLDFCQSLGLPLRQVRLPVTDGIDRWLSNAPGEFGPVQLSHHREPDPEAYAQAPFARATPVSLQYRLMQRAKAIARPSRAVLLDGVKALRRTGPMRRSFAGRSRELADLLIAISRQPPMLSSEAVRADKLRKLTLRLDELRADFGLAPLVPAPIAPEIEAGQR